MDTHSQGEGRLEADTQVVGNQAADSQQVGSHRGGSPVGKKRHSLEAGRKDRRDMQEGSHRHRRQAEVHHICPHSEQHKDRMSCHDTSAHVIPNYSVAKKSKQKQMEDVPLQIVCFLQ